MASAFGRIVVLVDMDCFYVQVEQRRDPSQKGKPCAVVQYKTYQGGGIIAVGYEARDKGVTRGMWGDEAKKLCPEIHLFRVPEAHGKANLDRYREAGAEVINVLSQFGGRVERASIDEAYIELTDVVNKIIDNQKRGEYLQPDKLPNTHVVGWTEAEEDADKSEARSNGLQKWLGGVECDPQDVNNAKLSIAAAITEEMRQAVFHQTGFRCSAGISHNKMLSKLACGINKPNKQTVLPRSSIEKLFSSLKVKKIRNLGGKLGKSLVQNFDIEFIGEVGNIPLEKLVSAYGHKSAYWLHEVCKGIDHEPVKERHIAQSIGCGKNFLGPEALNTKEKVKKWMQSLIVEISGRLEKDRSANGRVARSLTVHARLETGQSLSRSGPLLKYDKEDLLQQCLGLIRSLDSRPTQDPVWYPAIISMSIGAKKFDIVGGSIDKIIRKTSPTKAVNNVDITHPTTSQQTKFANVSDLFFSKNIKNTSPSQKTADKSGFAEGKKLETNENGDQADMQKSQDLKTVATQHDVSLHETSENHGSGAGSSGPSQPPEKGIKSFFSPAKPSSSKGQDDVIFVSSNKPTTPGKHIKSFFETVKAPAGDTSSPCLIDQVFLKERDKAQDNMISSQVPPEGTLSHPLLGDIDVEVFKSLPMEIKQEILRSHKITSSVIQSSQPIQSPQPAKKHLPENTKLSGQRSIFNFIPTSCSTPKESVTPVKGIVKSNKRQHSDTSPGASKKAKSHKSHARKSPKDVKTKTMFSSRTNNDVAVPLGFFRQRSQLNSAISKALTKKAKWVKNP